jgi:hypothetical protein
MQPSHGRSRIAQTVRFSAHPKAPRQADPGCDGQRQASAEMKQRRSCRTGKDGSETSFIMIGVPDPAWSGCLILPLEIWQVLCTNRETAFDASKSLLIDL